MDLLGVACDAVRDVLWAVSVVEPEQLELVADSGGAPEEPFQALDAVGGVIARDQLVVLLGEILEARARLPQSDGFPGRSLRIDERRDLSVRSDLFVGADTSLILSQIDRVLNV
jgi:hypothetical protein